MEHLSAGTEVDVKDETLNKTQVLPSRSYNLVVEADKWLDNYNSEQFVQWRVKLMMLWEHRVYSTGGMCHSIWVGGGVAGEAIQVRHFKLMTKSKGELYWEREILHVPKQHQEAKGKAHHVLEGCKLELQFRCWPVSPSLFHNLFFLVH